MVALPLSPHELDGAARSDLSRLGHWNIVFAVYTDIACNSISLHSRSESSHDNIGISPLAYRKQAVCDGSIVLELAGDFVHSGFLRVFVRIPSIDKILAQPDLLDKSVGRCKGREAQNSCGSGGPHCDITTNYRDG